MFSAKLRANIGSSEDALCSARSTDAIKLSIRVPVNVIFSVPIFSSRTRPCSVFLGRSAKTPPQSFFKIFTRHALLSPHREPGSFSGANQTCANQTRTNSNSFGGAHLGAARPRIAINLVFRCHHRFLREQTKVLVLRALTHCILDDPVFERMKADHHQPSARFQHPGRRLQQCFQIVQFPVYEDSESLKSSGRRMNPNPLVFPVH